MRARAVVVGGLLAVVALFVSAALLWAEPTEFGWFAYTGSASDASPHLFVMTARREFAFVLVGVGLLVLGTLIGFTVGRRRRSRGAA